MMLVRSSIDAHLPSLPDHVNQDILHVWVPSDEHKNKDDDSLCSRNFLTSSQISTEVNMSETSKPNIVYKRRRRRKRIIQETSTSTSTPTHVYKRKKDQTFSCSSSKSNMENGSCSLKQNQIDDLGECSSSVIAKDILETNSCIAFLGHHLVLERLKGSSYNNNNNNSKETDLEKGICDLRACKVCERSTLTLKMLICDLCEEPFHMSCCKPVVRKVPNGDWLCHFCSRKRLKILKETSLGKSTKGYFGPIVDMLKDVDCYESDVRIGQDFQAEVPDWTGPPTEGLNDYSELMEISPLECSSYQDCDSSKISRLSSIGNWLQCREIIDTVNGTICGKWRRAPLFEVQSDDWECFSSVLWDPTHADCAVPQELDTDQVLKQVKYIEMLRPRLSAKRWKLGVHKGIDREEHTQDPRNTQKL